MPELSNTVRHRLGARPAPPQHPDADTLNAYVEQSLPLGERNQVLEHLAACAFCREVVTLSLPSVSEPAAVHTLPVPSRFWKFGLRWAGALAVIAIAIGVAFVVERPTTTREIAQNPVSKASPTPGTAAGAPKTEQSLPADDQPATVASQSFTRSTLQSANGRSNGSPGAAAPVRVSSTDKQEPLVSRGTTARNDAPNAGLKDALDLSPTVPLTVLEASGQAKPQAPQNRAYVNSNFNFADERVGTYTNSYQYALQEQAKAEADRVKKQSTLAVATPNPEQDAAPHKGFLRKAVPIGPIASSVMGALKTAATGPAATSDALTSSERGSTSFASAAPVRPPINARVVAGTAATVTHDATESRRAKQASPDQLHWRVQDGKLVNSADLNQWHEAYPGQSDEIQFKVVQAQGHEVWAGGTNATLVHSWNGGVDWQKLSLGDAASGDIEKISFSGGDVQVKTSNGQHLISRDGGKTWTPLSSGANPQK